MPDPRRGASETKAELNELVALIRAYVVQETVGPLKQIGRTLAFGSAAAIMFGIAAVLSLVGFLRMLQTETGSVFAGEWNWVPYLLTIAAAMILLGLAAAIGLRRRSEQL
ncbi:MAG: hypothetical protein ACYDGN_08445 [Acidimicrobiales bacterium]